MGGHKQIQIRLVTLILIIVLIIAGIVTAVMMITNKGKNKDKKETNTIQSGINEMSENNTVQDNITADFELSFLKIENEKQNMIYSPLSIKYALSMLKEGANGNTKTQIDNALKNTSLTKYENIEDVLSLANAIFIRENYSDIINEYYVEALENKYNAEVKYDAFRSARNINNWISDKTFDQINNILTDEQVTDPSNRLTLINALAIDMEWKNMFDTSKTYGRDFTMADGKTMQATMMNKETSSGAAAYYKDDDITALSMDLDTYDDVELEFVAIMPKNNLQEYIKTVKMDDLDKIINKLKPASETKNGIKIAIPKFSFDYELNLKTDLEKLGITDAFLGTADFSGISNVEDISVGAAIHKANIDFTEKGVKAAAVTVFMMETSGIIAEEEQPEEVKIDNPFIYLIRDKKTGELWFVGTVYEPNNWEEDRASYRARYY